MLRTRTKTAMLMARFDPTLKKEVEKIFSALGISTSMAINLFFNQVKLRNGLPFEVTIPKPKEEKQKQQKEKKAKRKAANKKEPSAYLVGL